MKQRLIIHAALLFLFSVGQGLLFSQDLDGAASVALQGALPDTGFFAASNSFSRNTAVNVTNLDNGKTTQVIIAKGLEASEYGFLLTLSHDAANAIGIYGRDIGRVRVSLPTSSPAFSRYSDGRSFSGDPDYDPRAFVRSNSVPIPDTTPSQEPQQGQGTAYSETVQPFHTYTGNPASSVPATTMPLSEAVALQSAPPNVVSVPPTPIDPLTIVLPPVSQAIPNQTVARVLAPDGYTTPPSEPILPAKATAGMPYRDPGETDVILRSPSLVIDVPLPEMSKEPSGAEETDTVYAATETVDSPIIDYPTVYTHSYTPLETSPKIVPDEPNYTIAEAETARVHEDSLEDNPLLESADIDYPTTYTHSGAPFEKSPDIIPNEPEYIIARKVPAADETGLADETDGITDYTTGKRNELSDEDSNFLYDSFLYDLPDDEAAMAGVGESGVTIMEFAEEVPRAVTEDADDEQVALGEPWYIFNEDIADVSTDGEQGAPDDGDPISDMAEPNYLIAEETPELEAAFGVGGGEELPGDTLRITAVPPEETEYFSDPLIPSERTDFPIGNPLAVPLSFAINVPDSLEKGKHYVQIGGYSNVERIEAILGELGIAYPLAVMGQRYILIGPLNEGEGNALEQRFRVRGYPNAFVVKGK
ncbi:MAG: hypothetical protein LBT00_14775 [Spirochaetaceae bacterium]|jgi:hypothetical protein|nr:hypothetical protein [Spirochaetaceae bacterium]